MQRPAQSRKTPPPLPAESAAVVEVRADADDDPPYLAAWLSYRKRWREIWLSVLGWVVIAALVQVLPRFAWGETVLSVLFPIWAMVWFVGMTINSLRLVAFSCPRCGQMYFNPFVPLMSQMKCKSCGLRKFHVDDHGTPLYRLIRLRKRTQA